MSSFRCFDTYNGGNYTSSDYTILAKRKTLYNESKNIAVGNTSGLSPGYNKKKTGGVFKGPIYVNPRGTDTSGCLIGAQNYGLLYDVIYGKHVMTTHNPNETYNLSGQSWSGNIMDISYNPSACVITNLAVDPSCNTLSYPSMQDMNPSDDPFYPGINSIFIPAEYPGMIIDPNYEIFDNDCNNGNNYIQNVKIDFDKQVTLLPELMKWLSTHSLPKMDTFPHPIYY
jgi:hypothetical protein